MIKQGQIISFQSVAQAANVSTAYLYKQSELRSRIESLRNQQKQRPKLKQQLPASENSRIRNYFHIQIRKQATKSRNRWIAPN